MQNKDICISYYLYVLHCRAKKERDAMYSTYLKRPTDYVLGAKSSSVSAGTDNIGFQSNTERL